MEDQENKKEEQGNQEARILIYLIGLSLLAGLVLLSFDHDYTINKNLLSNRDYYREFE